VFFLGGGTTKTLFFNPAPARVLGVPTSEVERADIAVTAGGALDAQGVKTGSTKFGGPQTAVPKGRPVLVFQGFASPRTTFRSKTHEATRKPELAHGAVLRAHQVHARGRQRRRRLLSAGNRWSRSTPRGSCEWKAHGSETRCTFVISPRRRGCTHPQVSVAATRDRRSQASDWR